MSGVESEEDTLTCTTLVQQDPGHMPAWQGWFLGRHTCRRPDACAMRCMQSCAAVCTQPLLQAHEIPLAQPFDSSLSQFQKLLVLRCLRPDRVLAGVRDFVSANLGQRFIEPPPFDLTACFKESSPSTPLVFVLSPGGSDGGSFARSANARAPTEHLQHCTGSKVFAWVC